jgi:SAM-dependent methyltransferase
LSEQVFAYPGKELDTFLQARNWRNYWATALRFYIAGDVLEVGAGIGANTAHIHHSQVRSIHCLEPDPELAAQLRSAVRGTPGVTVGVGTICSVAARLFDTILYIDVLEHIEDDKSELARAARLLRPGGRLIVLAPAYQALYSPFDEAIGHYRRYDRRTLVGCSPPTCRLEKADYLDCVGLIASAVNKTVLRQSIPALWQMMLWDKYMIPVSRVLDPLLGNHVGKSVVAVWVRAAS